MKLSGQNQYMKIINGGQELIDMNRIRKSVSNYESSMFKSMNCKFIDSESKNGMTFGYTLGPAVHKDSKNLFSILIRICLVSY